jgi:pyridoxal phosphate enzyme (YggS family)
MTDLSRRIADNLVEVRQRIAEAARASGRKPEDVTLVAVTKYVTIEAVRATLQAGCLRLGESRPQQLWERAEILKELSVQWHLIGHLQRNKIRRTLPLVAMIHSVDSPSLADALERTAAELGLRLPILLEVNVSGEAAKHGFAPEAVEPCLPALARCRNIEVRGLMCMAGLEGGLDRARSDFAALRCLRDRLRKHAPEGLRLDELSMGMSGDYEVAVSEGATMVRIGSALYEGIVA